MKKFKIAFISGRLADVDGVSLEVDKWIEVMQDMGHTIYTIAGQYTDNVKNVPAENQLLVEDIAFGTEEQQTYESILFPYIGSRVAHLDDHLVSDTLKRIRMRGTDIAEFIYSYIKENQIDLIIGENTNAMPMSFLAAYATYVLSTKKRVATLFHHHDFWWERSRFSETPIESFLHEFMPPLDSGIAHATISSYGAHTLRTLKRISSDVVHNCEDFRNIVEVDDYNRDFRKELGFKDDDLLFLQPTRVVPRKRIEDSVCLVGEYQRMYPEDKERVHFVISLYQGDETDETYIDRIKELCEEQDVKLHFIADRVASERTTNEKGQKMYTNRDVLAHGDIVLYLPIWEGFGNALLEAHAAKQPVVIATYMVYKTDIMGHDFDHIEIKDDYDKKGYLTIPPKAVKLMHEVLHNPERRKEMVETNFRVSKENFGFEKLTKVLGNILEEYQEEIAASHKRILKSQKGFYV